MDKDKDATENIDDLAVLEEDTNKTTSRKFEGIACSRCRKHKIKCSKTSPCSSCIRMGLDKECNAMFGISTCWLCRRSKLKCDRQRPCGTCMKRGKAMECLTRDPTISMLGDDGSVKHDDDDDDVVVLRDRMESPDRPWPLQLEVKLEVGRLPRVDECYDVISQVIFKISQVGYDYTSILYMFNTMGEEISCSLKALINTLASLRSKVSTSTPQSPPTLPRARSDSQIGNARTSHQASGSSSSSWTVYWQPNGFLRQSIRVGQGLGQLLHRNPEEIVTRAARCEVEIPSSDVEFMCMILDDLLSPLSPELLRYQRICRRSSDGRLEESSLVKSGSFKDYDEHGRVVCATHTVEVLEADEWDVIHQDTKKMSTYLQLLRFLGEETTGEKLLMSHKRDILFDEHFATLNQSEAGRNKLRKISEFLKGKIELIASASLSASLDSREPEPRKEPPVR